jgi:phosphomannomutase
MLDWKILQNGSDLRGVAMEGIPGQGVNLTPEVATILGKSFAAWLDIHGKGLKQVAVGCDSRISGPVLKAAFIEGLVRSGYQVLDCGMASTPAMFMTTLDKELRVEGSVMLTASHLPFNRNGMKFFTEKGGFDKVHITELLQIAQEGNFVKSKQKGEIQSIDFISEYAGFLVDTIRKGVNDPKHFNSPLQGLKIIVDAGNGAGGFFADKVLVPLGANIQGSQYLEPDGHFPNHVPNPEDGEAMASICAAVKREKADLGIIFDTDVDRAAIVDANGNAINRSDLIALISSIVLEEHPGSVIVTDSITSAGLKEFIEGDLKGVHHRFKRGYKNVINEAQRLNAEGKDSWLAIETSGHAALRENHFLDDGAFLVSKLLIQMARMNQEGKTLTSLIKNLKRPVEEKELRLRITTTEFVDYGNQVIETLASRVQEVSGWILEKPNYEGVRIRCEGECEDGWFLLRLSLHDPVMPLNVESNVEGGVLQIVKRLKRLLEPFNNLDNSPLYL